MDDDTFSLPVVMVQMILMVVGVIREALIKQTFVTIGSPMPHLGMNAYLTNGRKILVSCDEILP